MDLEGLITLSDDGVPMAYEGMVRSKGPQATVMEVLRRLYVAFGLPPVKIMSNITPEVVNVAVGSRKVTVTVRFYAMPDAGLFIGLKGVYLKRLNAKVVWEEDNIPLFVHILTHIFQGMQIEYEFLTQDPFSRGE